MMRHRRWRCGWLLTFALLGALVANSRAQDTPVPSSKSESDDETAESESDSGSGSDSDSGSDSQAGPTRDALAPTTDSEPSSDAGPLTSWILEGELVDDEDVVRSFLRPLMQESQNWSPDDQKEVRDFLLELGYHSSIVNEALQAGGVRATINLQPATLVRHIEVSIGTSTLPELERFKHPLFADEIGRRMALRPGKALAADESSRSAQLLSEAERLRAYLINDGFYEAEVTVSERADGPYEAHILVRISPGPPYFIGNIEVVGNGRIETKDIVKIFHHEWLCVVSKLCFGSRRFSRQTLIKDVQKLVKMHQRLGFPGVRIQHDFDPRHSFQRSDKTVNFRIDVRERRRIDVTFEGNTGPRTDTELAKHLTLTEVASYDDVEVQSSADAIRDFYQSKGYFETQVNWERELFPDVNFERILFYIDEGAKLQVRRVSFTGNKSITASVLRDQLRTRVYKRIIIGDSGGFATTQQLRQDVERIMARYRLAGFRDAQVRLEVSRQKDLGGLGPSLAAAVAGRLKAGGLFVRFHIDEGPRTLIEDVEILFDGEHTRSAQSLRWRIKLAAGDNFLEEVAREDGERLRRHYFAKGFPRARVTTTFRNGANKVIVTHTVQENSPARIGKVAVRGNFKTRDWVILKELKFKEGDLLTVAAAEEAQANLRQSALFATVQITYVGRENPRQETVNVLVRVEERHDNLFGYEAGAGFSTDSEFFSEVGAAIKNMGGIGARMDVRALLGQKQRLGEIKLRLPRWVMRKYLGTELNFLTSGSYVEDETERFGELTTVGGTVAVTKVGRRGFFRDWRLSLSYNYRRRNRDVFLVRPAGNNDDIQETKVTTISSAVGPRLIIDKRKGRDGNRNPLTPGLGHRLEFRALFAEDILLGSDRFVKFGFSGQKFWSFGERLTFSVGLRYDHGVPLGGVSLLPEVERFFAGGDASVRGYEEDHLEVELIENPLAPFGSPTGFRVVPAGGNIRLIQNIDLQIEVWDDPWLGFPIASALFLDTGAIKNSLIGVERGDLSYGAGVALVRWVLPVGSLSIEYAVPLTIKTGDNPRGRFHVNLGVLF